jgi:hypothetical protein
MQGCFRQNRSRCIRSVMRTNCWIRKRSYYCFLNLSFEGLFCVACACVANVYFCVGICSFSFVFVGVVVVVLIPDVVDLVLRLFVKKAGRHFHFHPVTVSLFVVVEVRMDW